MQSIAYSPVNYRYIVVIPPTELPFSVADLRQQAKIDRDDPQHNQWIEDFIIRPVVETAERMTQKYFIKRTIETYRDNFDVFELRRAPFDSLISFKYFDIDNVEIDVPTSDYYIDIKKEYGYILPVASSFPQYNIRDKLSSIMIRFVSGYGDTAADLMVENSDIIKAMMQHAVFWYQNRGDCCNATLAIPPDVLAIYQRRKKMTLYGLQKRG